MCDFGGDRFATLGRHEIDFGQRHKAMIDAEQIDDGEMLARLRHHAVVGSDDQQDEVDAAGPCQHVVNELLVTWNVHEAQYGAFGRGQIGETEIDRDAALFLLLEPISVDAGECADERCFAVVDVTGSADDHRPGSAKA